MHVLTRSLNHGWADRQNFFAGGNMFMCLNMRKPLSQGLSAIGVGEGFTCPQL
jgi:hypothetical protein